MTDPESSRPPPATTPGQAPLDYARPGLDGRGRKLWRQMLEAFGFLAIAAIFCVLVVTFLEAAHAGIAVEEIGGTLACVVALAAVLAATHRRRAWRGLLFVMLLLIGVALLLVGLCFAIFAIG